jgi:protein tyrosine phosphatase (PTP) superfamily phosphohydrolase (DUF442 family)/YHS domain-containing protein
MALSSHRLAEDNMDVRHGMALTLLLMLLVCGVADAQCAASPQYDTSTIRNFLRVNENYCTGGQPRLEHLEALKQQGVTTIINLRQPVEHRAAEEKEMAEKLGLRYFNIPVEYMFPKNSDADEFLRVTDDPRNRPAFIHCTAAIRVGAFWMIRRVLRDGLSVADAEKEAEKVGLRNAPHLTEFARNYIAKHKPEAIAAAPPRSGQLALGGLDPVLLVEGKEAKGEAKYSMARGAFEYRFFSEETRKRFAGTPERYTVQLEGACARMGAPVPGDPQLWLVHDGRIYIFGSEECRKEFRSNPAKYLKPR